MRLRQSPSIASGIRGRSVRYGGSAGEGAARSHSVTTRSFTLLTHETRADPEFFNVARPENGLRNSFLSIQVRLSELMSFSFSGALNRERLGWAKDSLGGNRDAANPGAVRSFWSVGTHAGRVRWGTGIGC